MNLKDYSEYIGKTFGFLKILEIPRKADVLFECECGNKKTAKLERILSGQVQSCGCKKQELKQSKLSEKYKEYIGKKFHYLTITDIQDAKHVTIQCDCGKIQTTELHKLTSLEKKSCGCKQIELSEATWMEKYGVKNVSQAPEIKEKIRDTLVDHYGSHHMQNKEYYQGWTDNFEKLTGKTNPQKITQVKEKTQQTNKEKYGNICSLRGEKQVEQTKQTLLNLYGVENVSQSEEIKLKKIITNRTRRNVDWPFECPIVRAKSEYTRTLKYGYPHSMQSPVIAKKIMKNFKVKPYVQKILESPQQKY